jgi:hypothetical protein
MGENIGRTDMTKQFTDLLTRSGFTDIAISTVAEVVKGERGYPVFLATATAASCPEIECTAELPGTVTFAGALRL